MRSPSARIHILRTALLTGTISANDPEKVEVKGGGGKEVEWEREEIHLKACYTMEPYRISMILDLASSRCERAVSH